MMPTGCTDLQMSLDSFFVFSFTMFTCVFPEIPETPMSREFTVSFIVNLLSSLFREATCGECIYRRSDPLTG